MMKYPLAVLVVLQVSVIQKSHGLITPLNHNRVGGPYQQRQQNNGRQYSWLFPSIINGDNININSNGSSQQQNRNNGDRTSRIVFQLDEEIDNEDENENDQNNDEEFVFIAPTAMYTEDPSDQRYSAADWLDNVKSLPRSTILRAVQAPVSTLFFFSFVVSVLHGILRQFPRTIHWADFMCITSKPHSFLVSALGLLLVFRTNSAYQRFAEGRKIWENILSISRNISRLACLYEKDLGGERKHRIFRSLGAFPYLLHHHIQPQCLDQAEYNNLKGTKFAMKLKECAIDNCRDDRDIDNDSDQEKRQDRNDSSGNILRSLAQKLKRPFKASSSRNNQRQRRRERPSKVELVEDEDCDTCMVDRRALPWCLLPPSALMKCTNSWNRPLWVCDRLSQELTDVRYSDNFTSRERLAFLSQIDKLSKCIGECERIHQTAVPLNYARHSLRSLTIWLFSLPFALVKDFGILTAPVMGVISWVLFGVYQIGCSIEDPFQGSLRLSILCNAIYRDVMYDVDLKNKRDSAYQLEAEIEWNRMGPIEDSSKLIAPNGTPMQQELREQKEQKEQNEQPASSSQAAPVQDDIYSIYDPKATAEFPAESTLPSSLTPKDPLLPRP